MMVVAQRLPMNTHDSFGYDAMPTVRSWRSALPHRTILASVVIFSVIIVLHLNSNLKDNEQLQSLIPHQSPIVIDPPRDCSIPPPKPRNMPPTIVASYPGSGARMTWKLIRAVTGIMTGNDNNQNGLTNKGQVVTIKTHYPSECCSNSVTFTPLLDIDQSVILLRNPMNALPSYHNRVYEKDQELENHSTRAPIEAWIKWRDQNFEEELAAWSQMIRFWMEHHTNEHRRIITYEKLVEVKSGPRELHQLSRFVMRGKELSVPKEDIPCVWDYMVNIRADEGTSKSSKRLSGPIERSYTADQLRQMIVELKVLQNLYPRQLGEILERYLRTLYESQEPIGSQ